MGEFVYLPVARYQVRFAAKNGSDEFRYLRRDILTISVRVDDDVRTTPEGGR